MSYTYPRQERHGAVDVPARVPGSARVEGPVVFLPQEGFWQAGLLVLLQFQTYHEMGAGHAVQMCNNLGAPLHI